MVGLAGRGAGGGVGEVGGDLADVVVGAGEQADGDPEVVVVGAHEERLAGGHADAAGGEGDGGRALVADADPEVDAVGRPVTPIYTRPPAEPATVDELPEAARPIASAASCVVVTRPYWSAASA